METNSTKSLTRREIGWALGAGGTAAIWMLALAGWLAGSTGGPLTSRINVLFHSDSANWVTQMAEEEARDKRVSNKIAHPLDTHLWRPAVRPLYHLISFFLPERSAAVLANRLVVAVVFGLGLAALVTYALWRAVPLGRCLLLVPAYLLFSSNAIASLPEHYGISNGLLSMSYVLSQSITPLTLRLPLLLLASLLIGGTTITNALFVVGAGASKLASSARVVVLSLILLSGGALGALYYFSHSSNGLSLAGKLLNEERRGVKWFARKYLNDKLLNEPARAAAYVGLSFIYPAVAPDPKIRGVFRDKYEMISYEPWSLGAYSWANGLSALAWLSLLAASVFFALRNRETAIQAVLLLTWILFNALLHTMWGDEMLLYSPHWSWSLIALVLLGVKRLSTSFVAATVAVMSLGQIVTLFQIRALLATISI